MNFFKGYKGSISFSREGIAQGGLMKVIKRAVANEGIALTSAKGTGVLFVGHEAKNIQIIHLNNESFSVNGHQILAFESSLKWDITFMKTFAGVIEGGYFNVTFKGTGSLAITTLGDPLALAVTKGEPVYTDPHATVGWSGNLKPSVKLDVSLKTFLGRGSGESLQMEFSGDSGIVVIQPVEEQFDLER